jgi:adenylate kinase
MNILFIGPQGSGKGTQARIVCEKFNFFYFESGAYLRKVAESNPELRKSLAEGNLVPDLEMTSFLTAYLDNKSLYDDIVFDGFPRTISQYKFFKNWLTDKEVRLDLVIDLQISEEETVRRLTARRQDPVTGKIYNLLTDPPPSDIDQSKLITREDDKPEAVVKRLALYKQNTEPLIAELRVDTEVIEIDGAKPIDVIAKEIEEIINARKGQK